MIDSTPEYFKELGPRLTTKRVAQMLHLDIKTVIKHYEAIGGMRLGRNLMFFEKLIVQALREGALYAISKGQKMDGAGDPAGQQERENFPDQAGCEEMGERTKIASVKRILKADSHGIYNG
jgi:hypothetical protein